MKFFDYHTIKAESVGGGYALDTMNYDHHYLVSVYSDIKDPFVFSIFYTTPTKPTKDFEDSNWRNEPKITTIIALAKRCMTKLEKARKDVYFEFAFAGIFTKKTGKNSMYQVQERFTVTYNAKTKKGYLAIPIIVGKKISL